MDKYIDTHVHFWKYDSQNPDFDWINDRMHVIKKSYLPDDFQKHALSTDIYGNHIINDCIAVQAAESWHETLFLLDLAATYDFVKGVVGWIDIKDVNKLGTLTSHKKLKGFRHIIQAKNYGYMSSDEFRYFISKLSTYSYTYDLLLHPHQLHEALELVLQFPSQKFVIDHLAKPDIRSGDVQDWKNHISEFKHCPHVYAKLSGLVTEAYWHSWKDTDFDIVLDTALSVFGTDRLMYGSDWPVCLLAAEYAQVVHIIKKYISKMSDDEQYKIMYGNAINFYHV
ncbi:MAG: amidohydrolase family protein [Cytophagales bacterium]|nr:amidohydrolase family protein [Cytophagales bacterium]